MVYRARTCSREENMCTGEPWKNTPPTFKLEQIQGPRCECQTSKMCTLYSMRPHAYVCATRNKPPDECRSRARARARTERTNHLVYRHGLSYNPRPIEGSYGAGPQWEWGCDMRWGDDGSENPDMGARADPGAQAPVMQEGTTLGTNVKT